VTTSHIQDTLKLKGTRNGDLLWRMAGETPEALDALLPPLSSAEAANGLGSGKLLLCNRSCGTKLALRGLLQTNNNDLAQKQVQRFPCSHEISTCIQ